MNTESMFAAQIAAYVFPESTRWWLWHNVLLIKKEEIICDHLAIVIQDWALSEGLRLEPYLTLDKAQQLIDSTEWRYSKISYKNHW